MYNPAPFMISITALTSIFSFFFGGYYRERERSYRLWLKYVAYEKNLPSAEERIDICAELESRDRVFTQAKGLLSILLLTIILAYLVFQIYSLKYIQISSPLHSPSAFSDYLCFNTIIGAIVMINCLELLYIRVAVVWTAKLPFFTLRKRVTGQDRLFEVWQIIGCSCLKSVAYAKNRQPRRFYKKQDLFSKDEENID